MDIKKFFMVFCPLLLVIVMVAGAAAFTYDELSVEIDDTGKKVYKSEKSEKATGAYNVLLIGRDKGGMLTDTMMFVRVDNDKEEVNIISIPRDTYVSGVNVGVQKLNALYALGGIDETKACIEDILGLKIDYYLSITTDVFKDIVDELDGVQFYVPQNMYYVDPYQDLYIDLIEGDQLLDGNKAEQLVRFRSYPQGDIQRTQVQRDFIEALITQKKSLKYINRVDDIYRSVADDVETNIKLKDILENIIMFKNLDVEKNLNAYVLPNIPQYVGDASFVFVIEDKLTELLTTEFGIKEKDIKSRSGDYSYTIAGVSNQSSDYPDYEEYMETQNGETTVTDGDTQPTDSDTDTEQPTSESTATGVETSSDNESDVTVNQETDGNSDSSVIEPAPEPYPEPMPLPEPVVTEPAPEVSSGTGSDGIVDIVIE